MSKLQDSSSEEEAGIDYDSILLKADKSKMATSMRDSQLDKKMYYFCLSQARDSKELDTIG